MQNAFPARLAITILGVLLCLLAAFDTILLAQDPDPFPPDFFIEAEVDNNTPYVGQQITYLVKRYQAIEFPGQPHFEDHPFTGFWHTPLIQRPSYTTTISGREYLVHPTHIALFPTLHGPLTIDPARLVIPGSAPESDIILESEAIRIEAQPLPDGAPAHFQGAVGQFEINAKFTSDEIEYGYSVTLVVEIKGSGNIASLVTPTLPEADLWVPGDILGMVTITDNIPLSKDVVKGSRRFEWSLSPIEAGQQFYPAIRFSYFDPHSRTYHSIRTDPIPITVRATENTTIFDSPVPGFRRPVKRLTGDIRHIKPVPQNLAYNTFSTNLVQRSLFLSGVILPFLAVSGVWIWQRRRQQYLLNTPQARRRRAQRSAQKILATTHNQPNPYATSQQALSSYLSDKLDRSVLGLTSDQLLDQLNNVRLNPQLTARIQALLAQIEAEQYAPTTSQQAAGQTLIADTRILIDDLEKFFSKRGM